ncbi:MAG: microcin C ABC transporter permease YejB [Gammaproteobacteria bacterium]|nr:microcin C ABC transporter permease YejB [Gammaproteobacteria bacterium]MCW8841273.1 microcin C ABC transporter permease YejB [Gammaproteobacteria bacterium]MCW8927536.1 microcin C ABC transporter permease YejB [Gammaproteobacteria bacterium]MCW8958195.1 microcin C ABC transporter permease YejB [Gammaproteobacteria bacterium]MCW8972206.1 microcin C ABC transporter permease YejB [Gammaproteobacteria bacterium]
MAAYILKRLLLMIPTLLGVLLITFVVIQFVPGGPVEQLVAQLKGQAAQGEVSAGVEGLYRGARGLDEERIEELKAFYGFDKPAWQRFVEMLGNYLTFNLGESYFHHQSVLELVVSKLPVSISLGVWTFFITYLTCIPLGVAKAVRDGTPFDVVTSTIILIGYAIPGFVLGITLLVLFGGGSFWDIFPLRGLVSDNWEELSLLGKVLDYLWHMVLPITASVVGSFAVMTMLTKNSFLDEIRKQYVLTARAKGLSENAVLYKHVFRNAIIPLITGFPGAFIGAFFTGSLLIETIFSLDGLGLLSYNSVMNRDYPVVLGTLYLFTLLGLIGKLLTDICYVIVDPRIQFESIK